LLVTWVIFRAPSLAAAGNIFSAMLGSGTPAPVMGLRSVALAAAVVFLAPTSQSIVARIKPYAWLAPAAALATVLLLMKLGDGPAYEFIYFRF
ncbi:MAG TPA: MBOAT family protein, partial [Stellaceae bacterium]|nr:MBOAT family protein [Stellaceae bacterium]